VICISEVGGFEMKKKEQKKKGIGGWLILPIIGFISSIFIMLIDLVFLFSSIGKYLYPIELFIFLDVGMLFLYSYTLILIFKKKKNAPTLVITTLWMGVVYNFIASLIGDYNLVFGSIIGAIIWTMYFKKSERVKNTFIK